MKSWFLPLCAFVAIALFFQHMEGAYRAELGAHADEAAHFVTGLFIRDLTVFEAKMLTSHSQAGLVESTRYFVNDFYDHYPKIGLGMWPPAFYGLQTLWTLVFPATKESVLVLMALVNGSLALLLFRELRTATNPLAAWAGGVLVLTLPLTQQYGAMVMAETVSALWMFSATVQFGRYLQTERPRHMYAFGTLASLAIMTKGTGLALALVPPLALIATGKLQLCKRFAFWAGGALVLVFAGPWTIYFANVGVELGGWESHGSTLAYAVQAAPFFSFKLLVSIGVLLAAFAAIGAFTRTIANRTIYGSVFLSLIVAVLVFQALVPASQEERHITSVMPAVVFLAITGASDLGRRFSVGRGPALAPCLLTFAYIGLGLLLPGQASAFHSVGRQVRISSFRILEKGCSGFGPVAARLVSRTAPGTRFLVSSDAPGEGMFISEVALRDERPGHIAQRVSKVIAESNWMGNTYHARFETAGELQEFLLKQTGYEYLIIDRSMPAEKKRPHHDLILAAAEGDPAHFLLEGTFPITRGGAVQAEPIRVFRVKRDVP